jgi:pimeloyl-ACP methyl ester carboxylesterase
MKNLIWTLILFAAPPISACCQKVDTLVDVGGYKLHFTVITGKGTPILFEAGGGNDGTVWDGIVKSIANITKAPIILYDRRGLRKSSNDSIKIGIEYDIKGLKKGLTKLGFQKNIMLVLNSPH